MRIRIGLLTAVFLPALLGGQSPPTWRLAEDWRKGGEIVGPYAFESVVDLKAMPGGRVIRLDGSARQLHVLDSSGNAVLTVGRDGAGPGEFRLPLGVAVAPDGRFAVNDPQLARISLFAPNGDYLRGLAVRRSFNVYFGIDWDGAFLPDGRLIASVGIPPLAPRQGVPGTASPFADSALVTERWSDDFSRADSTAVCVAPLPIHSSPNHYATIAQGGPGRPPAGWVFWTQLPFTRQQRYFIRDAAGYQWGPAAPDSRELVRYQSGRCGAAVARITLRGARSRVPDRMRDSALRFVRDEYRSRVPREYPWYRALHVDDENNLWVERDVAGGRRFDVYASDGRLLAEMPVPEALDTNNTSGPAKIVMAHGRLYGFVKDADDIRYLVSWRIVR